MILARNSCYLHNCANVISGGPCIVGRTEITTNIYKKSDIYKEKRFFLKKNAKKFAHVKKKQYFCTRF